MQPSAARSARRTSPGRSPSSQRPATTPSTTQTAACSSWIRPRQRAHRRGRRPKRRFRHPLLRSRVPRRVRAWSSRKSPSRRRAPSRSRRRLRRLPGPHRRRLSALRSVHSDFRSEQSSRNGPLLGLVLRAGSPPAASPPKSITSSGRVRAASVRAGRAPHPPQSQQDRTLLGQARPVRASSRARSASRSASGRRRRYPPTLMRTTTTTRSLTKAVRTRTAARRPAPRRSCQTSQAATRLDR
jgi:hypothetical protein